MSEARTVIIEDEIIVANMLEICVGQLPGVCVVGTAHSGETGLQLCRETTPRLVLLDIELPRQNGLGVVRQLRDQLPETLIIIVSSHCEPYVVHELSLSKVESFVAKGEPLSSLNSAIRMVLEGKTYYSAAFAAARAELFHHAESYQKLLSPREIEVLILVAEGCGDKEIAGRLAISLNTVSTHRRNTRSKLNAHNDRDLMNYARKVGLVPLTCGDHQSLPRLREL